MLRISSRLCVVSLVALFVAGIFASAAQADTIRLANGDTINGKVVSVNEENVTLESEILGRIVLPRDKVTALVFGDAPAQPAESKTEEESEKPSDVKIDAKDKPADILRKLIPKGFNLESVKEMAKGAKPAANPEDVVKQLRELGGADPAMRRELMMKIPGFTSPKVQEYFDKQVNGLLSGDLSLGDIRNDAVKVRDQLNDLKKDLGPSGEALNGYLDILNGFIQETQSVPAKKAPKNPAEAPANR